MTGGDVFISKKTQSSIYGHWEKRFICERLFYWEVNQCKKSVLVAMHPDNDSYQSTFVWFMYKI
jgi:hypothetical protein